MDHHLAPFCKHRTRSLLESVAVVLAAVLLFGVSFAEAGKKKPLEIVDVIIVGDRVVDISYNLGVLPKAMSVRGSMWSMAPKLKIAGEILGCPNCLAKNPDILPKACKKYGIKRLIVEKSDPYCLYKANVKPEKVASLMEGTGVTIEYVDFSKGLDAAVHRTAELLGRTDMVEGVLTGYKKKLSSIEQEVTQAQSGKKVLIINGVYQPSSGKSILRIEAPNGYSDIFLLERLGCMNVGDAFQPADSKSTKGHYAVKKTRQGFDLSPLLQAKPDVIVITQDAYAVQKALAVALAANPALKDVPALANLEIYKLPRYVDSSVLEYPVILKKWAAALAK